MITNSKKLNIAWLRQLSDPDTQVRHAEQRLIIGYQTFNSRVEHFHFAQNLEIMNVYKAEADVQWIAVLDLKAIRPCVRRVPRIPVC